MNHKFLIETGRYISKLERENKYLKEINKKQQGKIMALNGHVIHLKRKLGIPIKKKSKE